MRNSGCWPSFLLVWLYWSKFRLELRDQIFSVYFHPTDLLLDFSGRLSKSDIDCLRFGKGESPAYFQSLIRSSMSAYVLYSSRCVEYLLHPANHGGKRAYHAFMRPMSATGFWTTFSSYRARESVLRGVLEGNAISERNEGSGPGKTRYDVQFQFH